MMGKHKLDFISNGAEAELCKRQFKEEEKMKSEGEQFMEIRKVYLDYNGTTPLDPSVVDVISKSLTELWGNPSSRSKVGIRAKESIENARKNICNMVNGNNPAEVTFMSGGTEANNHVIWNSIKHFNETVSSNKSFTDKKKPHIISSTIEHDSILKVLESFEKEGIINTTYIKVSKELGYIDPNDVINAVQDETVLITIMLANNETGIIQPVDDICHKVKLCRESRSPNLPPIFVHTDAAQAIGKIKVDVQQLGVDYLTIVGHKFYAPRIGALWVRSPCPLYTMMLGGGQECGKRAGTENTSMIVGLGEAARLVTEHIEEYNNQLAMTGKYLKQKLEETFHEKIVFNTPVMNVLPNTLNISFVGPNLRGSKVLGTCKHLEASVGAACHSHLGDTPSRILLEHNVLVDLAKNAIRLSIGRETTEEDICIIVSDLKTSVEKNEVSS